MRPPVGPGRDLALRPGSGVPRQEAAPVVEGLVASRQKDAEIARLGKGEVGPLDVLTLDPGQHAVAMAADLRHRIAAAGAQPVRRG
ncbi:hypothetical protein OG444_28440 [Streptomyces sp. NBC_01232]|uniref:hypothetical protein n=1 Tax=Streptomyces sp. NBC_01232 TaxID=2903786 RepID=UPI002E15B269|nr:hypothetical protein OG444_28440 [Streptomyces sp. NBC_01232]